MSLILDALRANAKTHPEKVAFYGHDAEGNNRSFTYFELLQKVDQAAELITKLSPNCIALRAENSLDWVIADLAAMQAETAIVPIPTFFSKQQVTHILEQAGVDLLIGDWPEQTSPIAHVQRLPIYFFTNSSSLSATRPAKTTKITFTSGSTGTPKGVCLSVENISKVTQSLARAIGTCSDIHMVLLPLSTLLENITGVYVPLLLGITGSVFHGSHLGLVGSSKFDGKAFAKALATYRPNSLVLTPALLIALIQLVRAKPSLAKPLRFVAVGGARVAPELIASAHQLSIPAYEGYGLSECASVVCLNTPKAYLAGSCGKVLDHVAIRISNDGELLVKGNTALGYLDQPFTDEWLATGDLAAIDDQGFVHLMGRKKNQIITSFGRNVSPEWIESQAQAFAPGCHIIVTGEAQTCLTAVVNTYPHIEQKLKNLNKHLPDYAQIQRLITVDDLLNRKDWFTSNARPRRQVIEQWVAKQKRNFEHNTTSLLENEHFSKFTHEDN